MGNSGAISRRHKALRSVPTTHCRWWQWPVMPHSHICIHVVV